MTDEIGAFAANFHPRDACRYLVNLANLRGGLDNITVLIVRIGQWVDPDSAEALNQQPPEKNDRATARATAGVRGSPSWSRGDGATRRLALVEDHPYRTAECPIDEALIDRLDELTRNVQEQAVAQAWSLDWAALASLRRQAADARAAKNRWVSLRKIGEIISLLGQAARFYRKNARPGSVAFIVDPVVAIVAPRLPVGTSQPCHRPTPFPVCPRPVPAGRSGPNRPVRRWLRRSSSARSIVRPISTMSMPSITARPADSSTRATAIPTRPSLPKSSPASKGARRA